MEKTVITREHLDGTVVQVESQFAETAATELRKAEDVLFSRNTDEQED